VKAVLLLIGPNDFSPHSANTTGLQPPFRPHWAPLTQFKAAYRSLLESRVAAYQEAQPKPRLISVCAGSKNGFDPCPAIKEETNAFNVHRKDGFEAYYISMNKTVWATLQNSSVYNGCDEHYNSEGHAMVAAEILPQVRRIMGWCDEADSMCRAVAGPESYCKYWNANSVCQGSSHNCAC